jgi:hypothetical protein
VKVVKYLKRIVAPHLNTGPSGDALQEWPQGLRIPQIIHQTFPVKTLPPALQENVDAMCALNPDWEHRLYDDADVESFIERSYGKSILRLYRQINPRYGAARADLFRYLLLYKEGGVYLDIKSTARSPLSQVLRPDDRFLISQWPHETGSPFSGWGLDESLSHVPEGEFMQWLIIASPGHPFLRAAIRNVLRNLRVYLPSEHGVGRMSVLHVTGPIAYTLAIEPLLSQQPHRVVLSHTELNFHYTIFRKFMAHGQLFPTHYASQTEPVVLLTPGRRVWNATASTARRLANRPARLP